MKNLLPSILHPLILLRAPWLSLVPAPGPDNRLSTKNLQMRFNAQLWWILFSGLQFKLIIPLWLRPFSLSGGAGVGRGCFTILGVTFPASQDPLVLDKSTICRLIIRELLSPFLVTVIDCRAAPTHSTSQRSADLVPTSTSIHIFIAWRCFYCEPKHNPWVFE